MRAGQGGDGEAEGLRPAALLRQWSAESDGQEVGARGGLSGVGRAAFTMTGPRKVLVRGD